MLCLFLVSIKKQRVKTGSQHEINLLYTRQQFWINELVYFDISNNLLNAKASCLIFHFFENIYEGLSVPTNQLKLNILIKENQWS